MLIAIDEFERMEDLFPGNRQEFLQLMGLFRATIQHRRGVRLLVSGAAPFDELDGVWDDHFIGARQIRLPFLGEADSVGLLTKPSPEFPTGAIPAEVAQEVYRRTGGQPFLLQVYGSVLVSRLNEEKRQTATVSDVDAVEVRAIEWAEPYFREASRIAPEAARGIDDLEPGKLHGVGSGGAAVDGAALFTGQRGSVGGSAVWGLDRASCVGLISGPVARTGRPGGLPH